MKITTKKIVFGTLAVSTVGLIILAISKRKKIKKAREILEMDNTSVKNTIPVFPLSFGSGMGDRADAKQEVKEVQKYLNQVAPSPYPKLKVDGKFGEKTANLLDVVHKTRQVNKELYNKIVTTVILI